MTIAPVIKTIEVKCAPERAFELFCARMGAWWPKDHHTGASPFADVIVEPRVGGRWFERGEDGVESSWGRVLDWAPPRRLLLAWQLDADFKFDPKFETELEISFEDLSPGTRVRLEHRDLERYGESAGKIVELLRGGWPTIIDRFGDFAEGGAGD